MAGYYIVKCRLTVLQTRRYSGLTSPWFGTNLAFTLGVSVVSTPVRTAPVSFWVKVPMVAIVVFLFLSGRTIATAMAVVGPGTIGPAPLGAGTSWKASGDFFFASRCKAEGGGKKLAADVAGRRARRSRSSVRDRMSTRLNSSH